MVPPRDRHLGRCRRSEVIVPIVLLPTHAPGSHNEGRPRTRQARRRAVRHLPLPDLPGTSPSAPVSSDTTTSFRGNGVRTRLRVRWRGCDSLMLVAWKAPAGVLGNGAIFVANKPRYLWSLLPRLGTPVAIFSTPARHDRRRIRGRTSGCRIVPTATMAISQESPLVLGTCATFPKVGWSRIEVFQLRFDLWRLNITQCGVNRIDASLPVSAL